MSLFERLTPEQINGKIDFINRYANAENSADGSLVDANSNVDTKNIGILESEMYKPETIQINRAIIQNKLKNLFPDEGEELAKQYVQDIESHLIYVNDETSIKPYCASITLFPFLLNGTKPLGGTSKAPKNLRSFTGSFVNLVYQVAAQFSGAIATVEWPMYFDYFARKTYGDNYLETNKRDVEQELQGVVYSLNQPAAARGNQSVFWNTSMLDKYYFEYLFGEFVFPDGSKPNYESVRRFQDFFMDWFRREREKELLTYPVLTASLLVNKDGYPVDDAFARNIAKHMSKGLSFFVYESDTVDSLSSCCFDKNQKVLVRNEDGVKLINIGEYEPMKNLEVFFNGSWVKSNYVSVSGGNQSGMYEITTANNKTVKCTGNHIFPVMGDNGVIDKRANSLTDDDYLMLNDRAYSGHGGTYVQGFLIGAYLNNGQKFKLYNKNCNVTSISIHVPKHINCENYFKEFNIYHCCDGSKYVKTSNRKVHDFIDKWVSGRLISRRKLNMDVCNMSLNFRKGILDGLMETELLSGRICTLSKRLSEQIEAMLTTMGINSKINAIDSADDAELPLYTIELYDYSGRDYESNKMESNIYGTFIKIDRIKKIEEPNEVYCFNIENGEAPYFTLANGVNVHNCRLRNELADNTFSYTLGAGGVSTGSTRVITINMNRMVQYLYPLDGDSELQPFLSRVQDHLEILTKRVHKYLLAHRSVIKEYIDKGLLPAYSEGFISIDKQFLTVGINGMLEASEFLVHGPSQHIYSELLSVIYHANKEDKKLYGCKFNSECVPAENLGVKNAAWDKKDGYVVKRSCYNSYFYPVEDESYNIIDRLMLHGKETTKYLDGGSACHLNISQLLTEDQAYHLIVMAGKIGVNYWTFNCLVTVCNDCGYINVNTEDHCTKCGSKDVDYATRVIGYLRLISSFSKARQVEAGLRYYNKVK